MDEEELEFEELDDGSDYYEDPGTAQTNSNDAPSNTRQKVDEVLDGATSNYLQKGGIPKPLADYAAKNDGTPGSPARLPAMKNAKEMGRNTLANGIDKLASLKGGKGGGGNIPKGLTQNKGPQNQSKANAMNRAKAEEGESNGKDEKVGGSGKDGKEKEKSAVDNVKEQVVSKGLSAAAQAYGVPAPVADALANKVAGPLLEAEKKKKEMQKKLIIGVVLGVFFLILAITSAISGGEGGYGGGDSEKKSDYLYGSGSEESLYAFLVEEGYCKDTETCKDSPAAVFYQTLKAELDSNSNLTDEQADLFITEFIFYKRDKDEMFATPEEITYIANIIGGSKFKIEEADKFKDEFTASDGYFKTYRADLLKNNDSQSYMENLYDNILSNAQDTYKSMEKKTDKRSTTTVCSQITVTGEDAGTYDLEEYVAMVVTAENDWAPDGNLENNKAQAVAARTYVIRRTANCTKSIKDSSADQNIKTNVSNTASDAAEQTAGQVLVNSEGDYISTEYDAFCLASSDDSNYYATQKNLAIPKTWAEKNIPSQYLNNVCGTEGDGGHGRGMSQYGSRYLSTLGYTYKDILNTFYDDAVLTTLGTYSSGIEMTSTGFAKRVSRALRDNEYIYSGLGLEGECAWYAVGRTNEILASVGNDTRVTSGGNGGDFCTSSDYAQFAKVYDVNDLKPGMLISWNSDKAIAGHSYGHVAVVEDVYYDSSGNVESIDLSEAGISSGTGMKTTFQYPGYEDFYIASSSALWNLNADTGYKTIVRQYICEGSLEGSTGNGCQKFANIPASKIKNRWSGYTFECAIDILS